MFSKSALLSTVRSSACWMEHLPALTCLVSLPLSLCFSHGLCEILPKVDGAFLWISARVLFKTAQNALLLGSAARLQGHKSCGGVNFAVPTSFSSLLQHSCVPWHLWLAGDSVPNFQRKWVSAGQPALQLRSLRPGLQRQKIA